MAETRSIVTIRSRREPILVCKKCLKRVRDGREIKRALKAAVKQRDVAGDGRRPRIVLTGCFGICPKRAVVLASGKTLQQGEYVLVADGDGADAAAAKLVPSGWS